MAVKKTVYPYSNEYAREHDELPAYRESNYLNRACAADIDKAIHDSNYEPFHYDLKSAMEKVTKLYGEKRIAWVMAATVQRYDYDGRYSSANKQWAQKFDIPREQYYGDSKSTIPYYGTNAHPTLVDGFITHLREHIKRARKPSITGQLQKNAARIAEKPAKEQAKTKKSEQEL